MAHNPRQPCRGDGNEPNQRDRTENCADTAGAALLHPEKSDQDRAGQRRDDGREGMRRHLQAFDCRKNGNRGCDDAVAVEQG